MQIRRTCIKSAKRNTLSCSQSPCCLKLRNVIPGGIPLFYQQKFTQRAESCSQNYTKNTFWIFRKTSFAYHSFHTHTPTQKQNMNFVTVGAVLCASSSAPTWGTVTAGVYSLFPYYSLEINYRRMNQTTIHIKFGLHTLTKHVPCSLHDENTTQKNNTVSMVLHKFTCYI